MVSEAPSKNSHFGVCIRKGARMKIRKLLFTTLWQTMIFYPFPSAFLFLARRSNRFRRVQLLFHRHSVNFGFHTGGVYRFECSYRYVFVFWGLKERNEAKSTFYRFGEMLCEKTHSLDTHTIGNMMHVLTASRANKMEI